MAEPSLIELAPGVHVWLGTGAGGRPDADRPNAGAIVDDTDLTVVDTLAAPSQARGLYAALEAFGVPMRRCVYTSSHVTQTGGSSVFWMAARYGRSHTSAAMDQPPNLDAFARLHPSLADEYPELTTRPVSHTVDTAAYLTTTHLVAPTAGQQLENLVVLVPEAEVVFAGAMASFGITPNAFDGDPGLWADSLGDIMDMAPVIVPAFGPVGGPDDVLTLQTYLYACIDAEGDVAKIPAGPWDAWADRDLDEVNVERAAMLAAGDDGVPPSMLRRLGLA